MNVRWLRTWHTFNYEPGSGMWHDTAKGAPGDDDYAPARDYNPVNEVMEEEDNHLAESIRHKAEKRKENLYWYRYSPP